MSKTDELLAKRINEGREYRDMVLRIADDDGQDYIVEGYATTFNEPYLLWREDNYTVYEQVDRNAFANTDMSDVIFQYNHEGRVFARISNGRARSAYPGEPRRHRDRAGTVRRNQGRLYEQNVLRFPC